MLLFRFIFRMFRLVGVRPTLNVGRIMRGVMSPLFEKALTQAYFSLLFKGYFKEFQDS